MSSLPAEITLPPPEPRKLIEKTAQYVAKHGVAFEQKIKAKESSNSKFLFLNSQDPYNAYYHYVIDTFRSKEQLPILQEKREVSVIPEIRTRKQDSADENDESMVIPEDPQPFSVLHIQNGELDLLEKEMTLTDFNVLKLVAKLNILHPDKGINDIINTDETIAPHLKFMNTENKFHSVYLRYKSVYDLVINHKDELIKKIDHFSQEQYLTECVEVSEKIENIQTITREITQKKTDTLLAYTSIDWNEFEIVETIAFFDDDNYEKPLSKNNLKYRSLITKESNKFLDELKEPIYEEDTDDVMPGYNDEEEKIAEENTDKKRPKISKGIKIKQAGESRLKRKMESGPRLLKCPLSGEMVPEEDFPTHLKKLLRDPKYQEEKSRYESKFKYGDNLSSTQVWTNINSIVNRFT